MGTFFFVTVIIASIVGIILNGVYQSEYGESPVSWAGFALQGLFLFLSCMNIPDPEWTDAFTWFLIFTLMSYSFGIVMCWKKIQIHGATKPFKVIAILAQIILPIGAVLALLMILALLFGNPRRNKHS